jgi:hypothetical protein
MGVLGGLVTCSISIGEGPVSVVGMKPESMGGVMGMLPAEGIPAAGIPAAGIPAAGIPAAGIPAAGIPAAGIPAAGIPAAGIPAATGIPPAGMGMGCIFLHGSWKVDCVTVWFLDMKLNWIMSYWAAWTLSGE